jgi:hypothetical protein
VLRSSHVHRRSLLRIVLGRVDVGPRRRVQDEVDLAETRRGWIGHVPLGSRQAARIGKCLEQSGAELAAGSGYDGASRAERIGDCVLQRCLTRSSSHGMPCSSGFAGSYSSVTRYAKRQSVSAS